MAYPWEAVALSLRFWWSFIWVFQILCSVSNIIEEYEEKQEQARNEARAVKSNQSTPSKKRSEFPGLEASGTATNEAEFSFGAPVADEGGVYAQYMYMHVIKISSILFANDIPFLVYDKAESSLVHEPEISINWQGVQVSNTVLLCYLRTEF